MVDGSSNTCTVPLPGQILGRGKETNRGHMEVEEKGLLGVLVGRERSGLGKDERGSQSIEKGRVEYARGRSQEVEGKTRAVGEEVMVVGKGCLAKAWWGRSSDEVVVGLLVVGSECGFGLV